MRDIACTLLSSEIIQDDIGNEIEKKIERIIPIIKDEEVYANEYYMANQSGFKPVLRWRVSSLNYDGESELVYMNKIYSIIRAQEITADETILICERKIKNVKD